MKLLWDTQKKITIKIKPRNCKGFMTGGLCESNQKNYNVHLQKKKRITVFNKSSVMLTRLSIFTLPLSSCALQHSYLTKNCHPRRLDQDIYKASLSFYFILLLIKWFWPFCLELLKYQFHLLFKPYGLYNLRSSQLLKLPSYLQLRLTNMIINVHNCYA